MIPWFHAHWLVLLFIVMSPCVCGNLFIQLSRPSITQDVVWIYSNSSSIQHTSADIASISYDEDIQPVMNLTQPSKSGLRGILYNRGLACSSPNQTSSSLFYDNNDIPRIALIQSGGPCSFADKLNWAQLDGAIGAIVYAENNNSINPENTVPIALIIVWGFNYFIASNLWPKYPKTFLIEITANKL
ncbi:uncharacterized protein BYT42DRAFT_3828 [Radiomyces spectabilis]|uniref:uncharacterized protein n=1 Tax=Radiomyces spectabilis TaxID=64574 RepID=UPI00221FA96E|nr:uncharacterized protein BYT42DRAFT_3828 [Radiomyces spectabilis]KAI8393367.1 hypothetical protein BYT42DRAFT_3828 [Radiomyces spectabilis]